MDNEKDKRFQKSKSGKSPDKGWSQKSSSPRKDLKQSTDRYEDDQTQVFGDEEDSRMEMVHMRPTPDVDDILKD